MKNEDKIVDLLKFWASDEDVVENYSDWFDPESDGRQVYESGMDVGMVRGKKELAREILNLINDTPGS